MGRFLFFMLALVLFSGVVLSIDVNLEYEKSRNVILKEYKNNLSFEMTIEDAPPGKYNVYTLSDVYILPSDILTFENSSNDYSDEFKIVPMQRLFDVEGSYVVDFYLNHRGVEKYPFEIVIDVLSVKDVLDVDIKMLDLHSDEVEIMVSNERDIKIDNLSARFSSVLFDTRVDFSIPENGNKSFSVPISSRDLRGLQAGSYIVDVVFFTPSGEVEMQSSLDFLEKENIVQKEETSGFLIRTTRVNKVNTGNTVEDVEVRVERNLFSSLFTSVSREPLHTVYDGFSVYYVWEERVGPSELYDVRVRTNYWYLILIIFLVYFVYSLMRIFMTSKLSVRKVVCSVKTAHGEFALRVRIIVRAKKDIGDVSVVDKVPRTVKIYKKFGLSMPDEIDTENRRLKWDAGDLHAGEERVYSYVVYSRVGFLGRFVLPSALVRYKVNDRYKKKESNSALFLASKED